MKQCLFASALVLGLLACSSGSDYANADDATNGGSSTGGMAGSNTNNQGGGGASGAGGSSPSSSGTGGSNTENGGAGGTGGIDGETGGVGGSDGGSGGSDAGAGGEPQGPTGESLYNDNCMQCHGPSGIGTPNAPENQHPVPEFAIWMVRNGSDARGGTAYPMAMLPFDEATLSPEQLEMILDYLNSMPQPTTGEALFHDYCANCHGADGKGGPTTRDLTTVDNLATEVPSNVRAGHHPGEYEMRMEYMPAQDASRLTDAELGLIAAYIETL